MDNLAALARYFNVSLDYLVTGEGGLLLQPPPSSTTTTPAGTMSTKAPKLLRPPLIHIRLGSGALHRPGIIAIGNCAVGSSPSAASPSVWSALEGCPWDCCSPWGDGRWAPSLSAGSPWVCWPSAGRPVSSPWAVVPSGYMRGRGRGCRLKNRHWRRGLCSSGYWAGRRRGPHLRPGLLTRRRWPRPSGRRPPVCPRFQEPWIFLAQHW